MGCRRPERDCLSIQYRSNLPFVGLFFSPCFSQLEIVRSSGCVICPQDQRVPLANTFQAQIIVFDLKYPLTAGAAVSLNRSTMPTCTDGLCRSSSFITAKRYRLQSPSSKLLLTRHLGKQSSRTHGPSIHSTSKQILI